MMERRTRFQDDQGHEYLIPWHQTMGFRVTVMECRKRPEVLSALEALYGLYRVATDQCKGRGTIVQPLCRYPNTEEVYFRKIDPSQCTHPKAFRTKGMTPNHCKACGQDYVQQSEGATT